MAAERGVLHGVERVGGEGLDQHAPRLGLGDAAGAEIEERVLVEIADRGAVAAFHVVGEDLELGLGVDMRRGGSAAGCLLS